MFNIQVTTSALMSNRIAHALSNGFVSLIGDSLGHTDAAHSPRLRHKDPAAGLVAICGEIPPTFLDPATSPKGILEINPFNEGRSTTTECRRSKWILWWPWAHVHRERWHLVKQNLWICWSLEQTSGEICARIPTQLQHSPTYRDPTCIEYMFQFRPWCWCPFSMPKSDKSLLFSPSWPLHFKFHLLPIHDSGWLGLL